jgi:hypothetical protein
LGVLAVLDVRARESGTDQLDLLVTVGRQVVASNA